VTRCWTARSSRKTSTTTSWMTKELQLDVRNFLRSLDGEAVPRYEAEEADPECDDASTVIARGLSDELQSRLEAVLPGYKIEYVRRRTRGPRRW